MRTKSAQATAAKTAPPPVALRAGKRTEQLESRCLKFVEVAEKLFLERGFAGTSVNEVVKRSGGSLATLYAQYGSKEELFEAVMNRRAAALFTGIFAERGLTPSAHGDIREHLLQLAQTMHSHMLTADSLAMFRLAVHEGPRYASVRAAVLNNGLRVFLDRLATHLANINADHLDLANPAVAAEDFLTLVQGQVRFTAACGDSSVAGNAAMKAHANRAVDAFLKIYAKPKQPIRKTP